MSLLLKFQEYILQQNLFSAKDHLLLAVSGGADSIVLTDLCYNAGYQFSIAHCNFQLRGEESDADELFVKSLGEKYNVQVRVRRFDTKQYAAENKVSIQEAARVLRYDWFEELINEDLLAAQPAMLHPDRFHVLTAHHADDNIETLLMYFFRGTGLHGLTAIPAAYGHIKRPLLSLTKEEILVYAKDHQLHFREDSSNSSSKYTRNFLRNELIPAISKVYPQVKENLNDNINRFKEIEKLYQLSTQVIIKKLCRQKGAEVHIPVKQLRQYNNLALIYEIIHPYGFSEKQVDEVLKLSESESGKYIDSPALSYRIIKHRHWLIVSPVQSTEAANIVIEENAKNILFTGGSLVLKKTAASTALVASSAETASLDADKIVFPLLLRTWKAGDYFYPLGMRKKKKLARFFIDLKMSKTEKEKIWVIESNQKIIWIVGQRIDDRFKISPSTKQMLQIQFNA